MAYSFGDRWENFSSSDDCGPPLARVEKIVVITHPFRAVALAPQNHLKPLAWREPFHPLYRIRCRDMGWWCEDGARFLRKKWTGITALVGALDPSQHPAHLHPHDHPPATLRRKAIRIKGMIRIPTRIKSGSYVHVPQTAGTASNYRPLNIGPTSSASENRAGKYYRSSGHPRGRNTFETPRKEGTSRGQRLLR